MALGCMEGREREAHGTSSFSSGMLTNITLHSVKGLRDIVNDSVLDIFFYTSPKYGPEVWVWDTEV